MDPGRRAGDEPVPLGRWTKAAPQGRLRAARRGAAASADLAANLDKRARGSVEGDCAAILAFVRERFERGSTRGLALFSSSSNGLWEDVEIPRPVRNLADVGPSANVLQLEAILETYPTTCTALADHQHARLFLANLGRIEEISEVSDDVPNRHDQGGLAQMRLQRHVDDHRQKHLKHVADELFRLQERRHFDRLILAGATDVVAELEREAHDYVAARPRPNRPADDGVGQGVLGRSLALDEDEGRGRSARPTGCWMLSRRAAERSAGSTACSMRCGRRGRGSCSSTTSCGIRGRSAAPAVGSHRRAACSRAEAGPSPCRTSSRPAWPLRCVRDVGSRPSRRTGCSPRWVASAPSFGSGRERGRVAEAIGLDIGGTKVGVPRRRRRTRARPPNRYDARDGLHRDRGCGHRRRQGARHGRGARRRDRRRRHGGPRRRGALPPNLSYRDLPIGRRVGDAWACLRRRQRRQCRGVGSSGRAGQGRRGHAPQ